MKLKEKLLNLEPTDKEILDFMYSEIKKEGRVGYLHLKSILKSNYENMSEEEIAEKYELYKARKIVLENTNVDNLPLGCLAAVAILVNVFNMVFDYEIPAHMIIAVTLIAIPVFYVLTLEYRIKQKSKKLVYFNLNLDALIAIIEGNNKKCGDA